MRKVIVATLALSPLLLHAQANSPAQPQSSSNTSIVQSQFAQPTELGSAAEPDRTNTASLTDVRVSTGIISPKLIYTVGVSTEGDLISSLPNFEREALVEMVVDETGKPSDVKIVKSVGPAMDKNVLAAVSQFRFKPGTLDHQPTTVPVNLEVIVHNAPQ
jgi:TonB family protein